MVTQSHNLITMNKIKSSSKRLKLNCHLRKKRHVQGGKFYKKDSPQQNSLSLHTSLRPYILLHQTSIVLHVLFHTHFLHLVIQLCLAWGWGWGSGGGRASSFNAIPCWSATGWIQSCSPTSALLWELLAACWDPTQSHLILKSCLVQGCGGKGSSDPEGTKRVDCFFHFSIGCHKTSALFLLLGYLSPQNLYMLRAQSPTYSAIGRW